MALTCAGTSRSRCSHSIPPPRTFTFRAARPAVGVRRPFVLREFDSRRVSYAHDDCRIGYSNKPVLFQLAAGVFSQGKRYAHRTNIPGAWSIGYHLRGFLEASTPRHVAWNLLFCSPASSNVSARY